MNAVTIVTQRIIEEVGSGATWEEALFVFALLAGLALIIWAASKSLQ